LLRHCNRRLHLRFHLALLTLLPFLPGFTLNLRRRLVRYRLNLRYRRRQPIVLRLEQRICLVEGDTLLGEAGARSFGRETIGLFSLEIGSRAFGEGFAGPLAFGLGRASVRSLAAAAAAYGRRSRVILRCACWTFSIGRGLSWI
jgi:hypothetical protein